MKLSFLSDLHIAPPATNRCTTPPDRLTALIERLVAESDEVVALGDLYDLSRPAAPWGYAAQYEAAAAAWPGVREALGRCRWVYGNHDAWLGNIGVPAERAWETRLGLVLARHGHQWDGGLKHIPGLAGAANFIAGWGHRVRVARLDQVFHKVQAGAEGVLGLSRGAGEDRTQRGARALLARGEAEVLVMGHTHRLGMREIGGRLLVETGSHSQGWEDWAQVDTGEGHAVCWRDGAVWEEARWDGARWELML
jgi:predicted phosphodiesterase